ncbi:MAG: glycosyltransferase family 2 protein [Patescibacteria group bacterium]
MLSIIIMNYKNAPLLRLCLKSLKRVLSNSFAHEIIVVDSSANLETSSVVSEEFPGVRYLPFKENVGYTKGVNEGIKISKGDVVFVANPDIIPLRGSLEKMYSYLKDNPKIGLLGPKLLNFDGSFQQSCFRFYTPLTIIWRRTFLGKLPFMKSLLDRFQMKDMDLTKPLNVDWLMGSALMASREAINKVGLMDENLFLYMSDVDWPRRFWDNGYTVVFYPDVAMYHYHRRQSRSALGELDALLNKQTRQHIKDAIRYFRKYGIREASNI